MRGGEMVAADVDRFDARKSWHMESKPVRRTDAELIVVERRVDRVE